MSAVNICQFKAKFPGTGVLDQDAFRITGIVPGEPTGTTNEIQFVVYGTDAAELSKKISPNSEAIIISHVRLLDDQKIEFVVDSLDLIEGTGK
jgi:hypothetical protein